jgi:hypothetical protein
MGWGNDLGLNLDDPETLTTLEFAELNRRHSHGVVGNYPDGYPIWRMFAAFRPDVLKRHRMTMVGWGKTHAPTGMMAVAGIADLHLYVVLNFQTGVWYELPLARHQGYSREQVLDIFAVANLNTVGIGVTDAACPENLATLRDWPQEIENPVEFPDGWSVDPEAFRSGMDFSEPEVSDDDIANIKSWYERNLGELPGYVSHLIEYDPVYLKVHRNRWEHAIKALPKQMMPYLLLHLDLARGFGDAVREDVLLAKAFGMTKEQVISTISFAAMVYGGFGAVALADRVSGDILKAW